MARIPADAHEVDRLARSFESAAGQVSDVGRSTEQRIHQAMWRSPRAQRHRASAWFRRVNCDRDAEELRDVARVLRRHADWIRETEDELRLLETRIRRWAEANPPAANGMGAGPDASLITWWPPSLSFEWHDLADRLRAHGAYF